MLFPTLPVSSVAFNLAILPVLTKLVFSDVDNLLVQGPEIPIYLFTTGISALITQSYLAYRFVKLSKSLTVGIFLGILITLAEATDLATMHGIITANDLASRTRVVKVVTVWLVTECAVDVLVNNIPLAC